MFLAMSLSASRRVSGVLRECDDQGHRIEMKMLTRAHGPRSSAGGKGRLILREVRVPEIIERDVGLKRESGTTSDCRPQSASDQHQISMGTK